jgi:hypothetical protein
MRKGVNHFVSSPGILGFSPPLFFYLHKSGLTIVNNGLSRKRVPQLIYQYYFLVLLVCIDDDCMCLEVFFQFFLLLFVKLALHIGQLGPIGHLEPEFKRQLV